MVLNKNKYHRTPEYRKKAREYARQYYSRPEVKAKQHQYYQEYMKEYYSRPEVRTRLKVWERELIENIE